MKWGLRIGLLICAVFLASPAMAQDSKEAGSSAMPPMGQPLEMKSLAHLVGDWDVAMKMKMSTADTAWTEFKGISRCTSILDGCAYQTDFEADMGGMKMKGLDIMTFDRETSKWQVIWIDNMAARISIYEGFRSHDTTIVMGKDLYMGKEYISRILTYNETPQSYDWLMESSLDGGKTFIPMGMAKYTKRQ